jgi:LPS-assembly protein
VKVLLASGLLFASAVLVSAQQDPFASGDPYESRFKTRSNFQIKFKAPEKGGEVHLSTKNPVHFEKGEFWEGSEDVVIEYQDVKIHADAARYDFKTKIATLTGHVVIDQGPIRLSGDTGTFSIESKTGWLENATADLPPTYHVVADRIDKVADATYRIQHGIFTACDMPDPEWSFTMGEATITLDDYARMHDVAFKAGPVPILYTPYIIWPTKEDRASGMLVPGIGYSNRRGAYLGLSYYWVTGRPTDFTFQLDAFSDGTIGLGTEARWRPTDESAGIFQGYVARDQDATVCIPGSVPPPANLGPCTTSNGTFGYYVTQRETRWKLRLDHVSDDLPWGFRGVLSIHQYSDEEFLQDFERNLTLASARQIVSRGFLTKNVGSDSLNIRFERTETFFSSTVIQERFPTIEFFHRTAPIGHTPFYFALQSSLSALYINRGLDLTGQHELARGTYGRFDVNPLLSFPFKEIPWLSLTLNAGGRFTGYTASTDPGQTELTDETLTRSYAQGGVSIVGPSFSKIYDASIGPWDKFKHVIEPRVDYNYISDVQHPGEIPQFDEIDTVFGQNQVRYALVNRLLARPTGGMAGSAEEIASLEIGQNYALSQPQNASDTRDPNFRPMGPLEAILRISSAGKYHLDGRLQYDTHFNQVIGTTLTAGANWGMDFFNVSWFASRPTPIPGIVLTDTDQLRFGGGLDLGPYFRFDTNVAWDVRNALVQEDRSLLTYKGSCFTVFVEVRQLRLEPQPRNDYRLVVNLKDIGTLLDVNGSLDALFGGR